jgi:2-methylcitrate dehydratase PrpD
MAYVTEALADFATNVPGDESPQLVRQAAERAILDTIAAIAAGFVTQNAECTRAAAQDVFGWGEFRPWFSSGNSMHFLGALLSNCAAASALDIDDGHRGAAGHPGAAIVPAILMECQRTKVAGKDLLAAVIVGYDVALRVGASRLRTHDISYASGIWTGYGVAAALARLKGLSARETAHALAIAGAEAPWNLPQGACSASSVKGSSPWSTVTAAVAVARAAAGATGSLDLLDRSAAYDVATITNDLSKQWLISETYQKPYASCRYTHPVIDAIVKMRPPGGWDVSQVQAIQIEIFPEARKLPNNIAPTSLEDAQFSIPFSAALALVAGASAFQPLEPMSLEDPRVLALAQRITVDYSSPDFAGVFPGRTPARVSLVIGGRAQSLQVDYPLGDVSNPMTTAGIADKFTALSRRSPAFTQELVAAIRNLQCTDSGALMSLLLDT